MGKRIWIIIAVVLLLASGLVLGTSGLFVSMLPAAFVIAEALQQSESLGETAYVAAWWLTWIGFAGVMALCAVRVIRKRKGATIGSPVLPLWIYGLMHLTAAWGLGLLEFAPLADVSGWLMAYVLLTVGLYLGWVFPLLLLGLLVRALWRWAKTSWLEDGRAAQIASVVLGGALLCSIGVAVGLFADRGYTLADVPPPAGSTALFSPTEERNTQLWFASMAIAPNKPEFYAESHAWMKRKRMTFNACANQLAKSGELAACARRAERALPNDGDDAAQAVLLNVCQTVERDGVEDLVQYFSKSCTNGIRTRLRQRRKSPIDSAVDPVEELRPRGTPPPQGVLAGVDCVERVAGTFSRKERQVLDLATLGHEPREIAALIGVRANTVSQRLSRLKRKIKETCFETHRPVFRQRGW